MGRQKVPKFDFQNPDTFSTKTKGLRSMIARFQLSNFATQQWLEMVVKRTFRPVANFGYQSLRSKNKMLEHFIRDLALF